MMRLVSQNPGDEPDDAVNDNMAAIPRPLEYNPD